MSLEYDLYNNITDNFISICKLEISITSNLYNKNVPIYFGIDEKMKSFCFSKVTLNQIENNKEKTIAHFYKRYTYTSGLYELIKNKEYYKNYRIKLYLEKENKYDNFIISFNLYVDKLFLLHIYELNIIPRIIYLIMIDSKINNSIFTDNNINNINNQSLLEINIHKNYKRKLYEYQKNNIKWMMSKEIEVNLNQLSLEIYDLGDNSSFYIKELDDILIFNKNKEIMIHPETIPTKKILFKGGVLSDEVGMGKTFSMIGLINETIEPENAPTLIICPKRLCIQWRDEINISCDLNIYVISSITQFKKLNLENIFNYDVIIVSYTFLTNFNYHLYKNKNKDKNIFLLCRFNWLRIVLDEGHEYLTGSQKNKKKIIETLNELKLIKSKFKWICSGTPYTNKNQFIEILSYLNDFNCKLSISPIKYSYLYPKIQQLLFRKNYKSSLKNQINIPEPIITNDFLIQGRIEKAIYDSALGDEKKMLELCNHILVSEQHINILGNKPIPLNEIHQKMTNYYIKKTNYLNKRLENINKSIEKKEGTSEKIILQEKYVEIEKELSDIKMKLNIFNTLSVKMKEELNCPICLEDLNNFIKTITPCGHIICSNCIKHISLYKKKRKIECPICRNLFEENLLQIVSPLTNDKIKLGTKMAKLIEYCQEILTEDIKNRIIIFSQWDNMLKLIDKILIDNNINHLILNGSMYVFNSKVIKFKLDNSIRIVLLSMEKAVSGLNLTEANHIILLDTLNTDKKTSKVIEQQAIGRAVRIGQTENVKVKRFIMKDTIEEEYFNKNNN